MMPRPPARFVGLALAAVAAAVPAAAQDALARLIGRPIVGIALTIEGRPESSPALLGLVDIRPGDVFAIDAMRRVVDRLSQAPRFESVRVMADERPDGVVLIFDLEPRHPIDRVAFTGDTGLGPPALERLVREQFGGVPAAGQLAEVEDVVRRLLRNEGYLGASARASIIPFHDPDRATLEVHVQAGVRTAVRTIEIRGRSPYSRDRVLDRVGHAPGTPFRERVLSAGLARVRDELRSMGYFTAIAQYLTPEPSDGLVDLVLTVEAGPLVRLEIVPAGSLPGRVEDLIPIRRLGTVDQDLLDDARLATERALRADGYWRASVSYARTNPTPDDLLIRYTIDRGKRYRVMGVEVPPGLLFSAADLEAHEGLKPGTWFSEDAALRALLAAKAVYQQEGFHRVTMDPEFRETPGRNPQEGGVVVVPRIAEGPRAFVARIVFELADAPFIAAADLARVLTAREGAPYVPARVAADTEAIERLYERQGFLNRSVEIRPAFDEDGRAVVLHINAREGPRVIVGEITVVGNVRIPREFILRELTLQPGRPYSEADRFESQRRLSALGSFRDVAIRVEPRLPGETLARIIVSVEEASTVTLGVGGGIEAGTTPRRVADGTFRDRFEVSPRASIDLARRNLGGRNRAVNLFSRVSLKPRNAPDDPARDGRGFGFTEYRAAATFRDRGALGVDTDLLVGVLSEQAVRTTFSYLRNGVNADLVRPVSPRVTVSARYAVEFTRLFDNRLSQEEQALIDRLFPQVRLSTVSSGLFWDRRDSQAAPTRGGQVTTNVDYAPQWLGSEVGFVKGFVQGTILRSLSMTRRVVAAGRAQLGLARGFARRVPVVEADGRPVVGPDGQPLFELVADLPASQRFFAGGSTTVRGFQLDRLGVPEILNAGGLSAGGNALVVVNTELRAGAGRLFGRPLTLVGFIDAGNVFRRVGELDLGRLRATSGFGFRYDSPLGPIRMDVGFKLDRVTFAGGRERRWEVHLSLGEVF